MNKTILQKAIEIATKAHNGQFRKYSSNGYKMPYIIHPMEVMKILWEMGFGDEITLSCAVLHDSIEDNIDDIYLPADINSLSEEIYNVVKDLTILKGQSKEDYLKKFSLSSINPRSLIVKAADRICNVMDFFKQDKEYSKKYLKKALPIQEGLHINYKRIRDIWGKEAATNLDNRWNSLWKI